MKPVPVGVWGVSKISFPERVWRRGGGIGIVKLGFPLPSGDGGGAVEAMVVVDDGCGERG